MLFPDHVHLFCRQIRINRRNHEQGQESSTYHPTDNGDPHSHPAFSTGTGSDSHRENTQNRRQTRHQNRPETSDCSIFHSYQHRFTHRFPLVGKLYNQNTVLRHQPDLHDYTDLAENIHSLIEIPQGHHRPDQRQRHSKHDDQGIPETLELSR